MPVIERIFITRDGGHIRYRVNSSGAPNRLVLIHPLAMTGDFWEPIIAALGPAADILTYDARGHGASSSISEGWRAVDHARDLADILDHIGWMRAIVAGASMGGCIALAFAADFPQRAAGLGLIDSTSWYDTGPEAWETRGQRAVREGFGSLVEFQLERWFSDAYRTSGDLAIDRAIATFLANDPNSFLHTCRMLGAFDMRPRLRELNLPCRVIVGENDYATPVAMARYLLDNIRGAQLQVIPAARHFTPLEAPGEIVEQLQLLMTEAANAP